MKDQLNDYFIDSIAFRYVVTARPSGYSESIRLWEEMKFVHVVQGNSIWNINGEDHNIGAGDILVFCKNDKRYIKKVTSKQALKIADIRFLPVTVYPMQHCVRFFYERPKDFCNVIPKDNPYYHKLLVSFAAINEEAKNDHPWRNESISNIIISMAINISRIFASRESRNTSLNNSQYEMVCKAISYIKNNLQNDLSRDTLSQVLYISPSYLSRIFKEYSGLCLQDYIVRVRVKNAAELISRGWRPLDAAFESGFSSSSGFYRAFHAVLGLSPKSFQKSMSTLDQKR